MAGYDLPTSLVVGGVERPIRSDYRAALDVMAVVSDPEISDAERMALSVEIMYEDPDDIPRESLREAVERAFWFLRGGHEERTSGPKPRLMDWGQDFQLIAAPVNRVLGCEVRSVPYLHWWTFLAAYREIGDCTFAQVVAIRKKRAGGKRLDKQEQQFYRENRELVDLERKVTEAEAALFDEWIG